MPSRSSRGSAPATTVDWPWRRWARPLRHSLPYSPQGSDTLYSSIAFTRSLGDLAAEAVRVIVEPSYGCTLGTTTRTTTAGSSMWT
ncbi:hypothetical protein Zm00014a_002494 [Zea mays]|uniref:Uncharacterized protein n=1 Tax=Zea mays TaxID=4577 RepID=A0A317YFK6_MAIZE|nr:hypothetical protein Zm00014a_002494 [Zea mays]